MKLCVVFHSGEEDRIAHGLSMAIANSSTGGETVVYFTYGSIGHILRKKAEENEKTRELIRELKKLNTEILVCPTSLALQNVTREELIPEIDRTMGMTTLLSRVEGYQILVF